MIILAWNACETHTRILSDIWNKLGWEANIKVVLKEVGTRDMNEMYVLVGPVMMYFEHGDERSGTVNSRTFETR